KEIHDNGISTYTFISPFFPKITDYKAIIEKTIDFSDYYMFENLNFRPHNVPRILRLIKDYYPEFLPIYEKFKKDNSQWDALASEIEAYCKDLNSKYYIEFHHGGFSKS
ncbi:MAG: radical SAM protein, partial [Candidatus Thorarchaeota archaeon]